MGGSSLWIIFIWLWLSSRWVSASFWEPCTRTHGILSPASMPVDQRLSLHRIEGTHRPRRWAYFFLQSFSQLPCYQYSSFKRMSLFYKDNLCSRPKATGLNPLCGTAVLDLWSSLFGRILSSKLGAGWGALINMESVDKADSWAHWSHSLIHFRNPPRTTKKRRRCHCNLQGKRFSNQKGSG